MNILELILANLFNLCIVAGAVLFINALLNNRWNDVFAGPSKCFALSRVFLRILLIVVAVDLLIYLVVGIQHLLRWEKGKRYSLFMEEAATFWANYKRKLNAVKVISFIFFFLSFSFAFGSILSGTSNFAFSGFLLWMRSCINWFGYTPVGLFIAGGLFFLVFLIIVVIGRNVKRHIKNQFSL